MRLDYLTDVEPEFCPMVRLYDFDPSQVELIRRQVLALASDSTDAVAIHELPFVTAVDNCKLIFRAGTKDLGVGERSGSGVLDCTLTPLTWSRVAWFMEVFLDQDENYFNKHHWLQEAFQWTEETSDTSLLFSPHPGGYW